MHSYTRTLIRLLIPALLAIAAPTAGQARDLDAGYEVEINKGKLLRLDAAASSVIVADPTVADIQVVSPTLIYVNGKKTGETSIFAVDARDNEILNTTVVVTHNLSKLNRMLKKLLPDSKVEFSTMDGALVMNGTASTPLEAEDARRIASPFLQENQALVNMVQTNASDQVMLKVRVAEVSRNELKRFGIHLESLLSTGNFVFGLAQGRDVVDAAGTVLRNGSDNSLFTNFSSNRADINGVVDALEDDGLVTILAEPTLTTMSGKNASFLAGGQFPIPVVGQDGQVTIQYQPFGVSLNFTPQMLSKDKISLTVAPEVSTLSDIGSVQTAGFNIPSLATRRASTTVELGSGQTFAVAGLLQNNSGNSISKFPALGDVPVLGALFRSSQFQHDQTELVILVTPYVVRPADEKQMVLPTDGFEPATDLGRILFGSLYQRQESPTENLSPADRQGAGKAPNELVRNESSAPRLNGPVGYVLK